MIRLAVTGHRVIFGEELEFARIGMERFLLNAIFTYGYKKIIGISGMAIGVDQEWAQILLNNYIPLHAYIPFEGQHGWAKNERGWISLHHRAWPEETRDEYIRILDQAAEVRNCEDSFVSDRYYTKSFGSLLIHRNRCMVNDSQYLCAVWNGKRDGGTWRCLSYAMMAERKTFGVDIRNRKCGWGIWKPRDVLIKTRKEIGVPEVYRSRLETLKKL